MKTGNGRAKLMEKCKTANKIKGINRKSSTAELTIKTSKRSQVEDKNAICSTMKTEDTRNDRVILLECKSK